MGDLGEVGRRRSRPAVSPDGLRRSVGKRSFGKGREGHTSALSLFPFVVLAKVGDYGHYPRPGPSPRKD